LGRWGDSFPPLRIATQDQRGFSPFSIAVYRGHLDLARIIVDISVAQYRPKDDSEKRERFHLRDAYYSDEESFSSDDDGDEVHVFKELVDEKFTIDDIGAVGETVKSDINPLLQLEWPAQFWRCLDLPEVKAKKELGCEAESFNYHYFSGSKGPWVSLILFLQGSLLIPCRLLSISYTMTRILGNVAVSIVTQLTKGTSNS
jgi:hypothetical protein